MLSMNQAKSILKFVKTKEDLTGLKIAIGNSYGYYPEYKGITISNKEITSIDFMMNYLKDTFDLILTETQIDLFCLLHEVGHFINGWICTPEEYNLRINEAEDLYEYRHIPDEYEADKFAANFIKKYYSKLIELY